MAPVRKALTPGHAIPPFKVKVLMFSQNPWVTPESPPPRLPGAESKVKENKTPLEKKAIHNKICI